jgi:hypothetical protein
MKLLQKLINFFKPYPFERIFAFRNDEKNIIHIMFGLRLISCSFAC